MCNHFNSIVTCDNLAGPLTCLSVRHKRLENRITVCDCWIKIHDNSSNLMPHFALVFSFVPSSNFLAVGDEGL